MSVIGCGFRGVALAHNLGSEAEVDALLNQAVATGTILFKPVPIIFWGGYSDYFTVADPDPVEKSTHMVRQDNNHQKHGGCIGKCALQPGSRKNQKLTPHD
ncbi:hypothetical protein [Onishia niordana]|uniref:hypothetical protein n=1 Tax=Onishia niordana TaxID=2508711 RepID=UPI00109F5E84|nr:hypothetical protein [Halomonas niordiana]